MLKSKNAIGGRKQVATVQNGDTRVPAGGRREFAPIPGAFLIIVLPALLLASNICLAELSLTRSADLEQLVAQGVPLVDVRTREEWSETGIIDGAHPLTFFDASGEYDWKAWLARLREIVGPDEPVILMCHSGVRSAIIAKALADEAGYMKVYDYESGIEGWLRDKRPTVPLPRAGEAQ